MTFNPNSNIKDSENLYRAVRPWKLFWREKKKKLATAAFVDAKGLSVDRDGERELNEVVSDFKNRKLEGSLVSGVAKDCKEIGTHLEAKPTKNIYHALILDSPTKLEISPEKREKLVEIFKVVSPDLYREDQ